MFVAENFENVKNGVDWVHCGNANSMDELDIGGSVFHIYSPYVLNKILNVSRKVLLH